MVAVLRSDAKLRGDDPLPPREYVATAHGGDYGRSGARSAGAYHPARCSTPFDGCGGGGTVFSGRDDDTFFRALRWRCLVSFPST